MFTRSVLTVLSLVAASAITAPATAQDSCPVPIDAARHGSAAIKALGNDLDEVAAAVPNLTTTQLRELLLTDRTLWIDRCGRPYYADPVPVGADAGATEPALNPSGDVFALHSRLGSSRTIYLDFDGYVVSGSGWSADYGTFTAPGYSIDSDPAFSATERARIADVWLRVAEDYAPFDVDVTTALPSAGAITRSSAADTVYGTRVAIVKGTNPIYADCDCGGIAYLGAFDDTSAHAYFQPAFVFTEGVGNTSKNIAEAATHEVGHNLALHHDGDPDEVYYPGQGLWSPIMGNSYYKPLSQWSKGEYTGANNTEDDVAIIHANGAPLLADDTGDSRPAATAISPGTVSRIIGSAADSDWFSFTANGVTSLTVTPQSVSPNLDASVTLFNNVAPIATDDPTSAFSTFDVATGLDGKVARVLTAGTYYAKVDGVGSGWATATGYSDYGSLGRYDLTLTTNGTVVSLPAATLPPAMVGRSYSASFVSVGGIAPYVFSASALPDGLTLSGGGSLTGVPTTDATFTFTIRVTDLTTSSASRVFSVPVAAPLVLSANGPAAAMVGRSYGSSLTATGGTPPYSFTVASGTLPNGVSLAGNGSLGGTPMQAGTFPFLARVTDAKGFATTRTYALVVEPALSMNTSTPPVATVAVPYTTTFTANGGQRPYLFTTPPGTSPPPGLTLAASGVLSGTPTQPGSYDVTVQVVDAGFFSASATPKVIVKPRLVLAAGTPPGGTVGSPYTALFTASGGTEPYRFGKSAGTLPAGLTLAANGTLSGTPTARGTGTFTVEVTDANDVADRRQFSVTIQAAPVTANPTTTPTQTPGAAAPVILTPKLPRARVGKKYATVLRASTPGIWRVIRGKLPKGVRLKVNGRVAGKPKKAGTYRFTAAVTVGDQTAVKAFRLVVRRR